MIMYLYFDLDLHWVYLSLFKEGEKVYKSHFGSCALPIDRQK